VHFVALEDEDEEGGGASLSVRVRVKLSNDSGETVSACGTSLSVILEYVFCVGLYFLTMMPVRYFVFLNFGKRFLILLGNNASA